MARSKKAYIRKGTDYADVLDWLPVLPERFFYTQIATVNGFDNKYLTAGWVIYFDSRTYVCTVAYHQQLFNSWGLSSYDLVSALLKAAWKLDEFWARYKVEDHYRLAETCAKLYAEGKGLMTRKQEVMEVIQPQLGVLTTASTKGLSEGS